MAEKPQNGNAAAQQAKPSLPEPKTETLEGKVEAEKAGYASELLAYRVMDQLSGELARRIDTKLGEGARVLLMRDREYAAGGLPLVEIRHQIAQIENAFTESEGDHSVLLESPVEPVESGAPVLTPSVAVPPAAITTLATLLGQAPNIVGNIIDVLAYFRSNYKITEREFDVADEALFSSVAGALVGRRIKPFMSGFYAIDDSEILSKLTNLAQRAAKLKTDRDAFDSLLPKSDEDDEVNNLPQGQLARIAATVRATDAVLTFYQGLRTAWTTPPEGQESTKLEKALVRERIEKLNITHLLWLGNLSSGGEATVRDHLVREDKVGFMGGIAAAFVLSSTDGEVIAADTLSQFGVQGFQVKEFVGGDGKVRYVPEYPSES